MTKTPAALTKSAFAKQLGVNPSYVTRLKNAGRLVLTDDGKRVMVAESMKRIAETRDPNRDDVAERWRKAKGEPETPPEPPADEAPTAASFQDARARKEHFFALKAELEYEQMIGRLCEVERVKAAGATIGVTVRSKVENMADQLAAELAAERDEARVHALLVEHGESMLRDIQGELDARIGEAVDPRADG